ncbi:hypothetical protein [Luteitalea sp.]|uniref:hypothetical protein n=1 Tax=Luteitalea sp. TaxID=2004800 RepID=UPI0025C269E8|nr:hypothetical protein [Luteitalea sp.]
MRREAGVVVLAMALWSCASVVRGQGVAESFTELQALVELGQTVTVVDASGREVTGSITAITPARLVLGGGGRERAWQEADVVRIRHRGQDSLRNGTLIGLGVGAGVAAVAVLAGPSLEGSDADWGFFTVAVGAGLGAAIGVGLDALTTKEREIFRKRGSAAQVFVQPMLHARGGGVRVGVAF